MKTKHIIHFPTWIDLTRIYENQEDMNSSTNLLSESELADLKNDFTYDKLKEILVRLNKDIISKINTMTTRTLLDWFHNMYALYDMCKELGKFAGVVYTYIKHFMTDHHKILLNFFTSANKELTQKDKEASFRFKPLSAEETIFEKQANEKLKALGLIK